MIRIVSLMIKFIQYFTLGWFGLLYRLGFVPYGMFRAGMETFYAEPSELIRNGSGLFHEFYCSWILLCEML